MHSFEQKTPMTSEEVQDCSSRSRIRRGTGMDRGRVWEVPRLRDTRRLSGGPQKPRGLPWFGGIQRLIVPLISWYCIGPRRCHFLDNPRCGRSAGVLNVASQDSLKRTLEYLQRMFEN
jgi:hypothetical protein